jgi:hypothetical protein
MGSGAVAAAGEGSGASSIGGMGAGTGFVVTPAIVT